MNDQTHAIGRFYGEPIAYAPHKIEILLDLIMNGKLQLRADATEEQPLNAITALDAGVLVLNISGSLVNRATWWGASYEGLKMRINSALAEPKVKGILLRVDSYGGEVDGLWDTLDFLKAAGQKKPIWAIADGAAYSAAFGLFSQTAKRFMTRTAGVGSVGVIAVHYDMSGNLKQAGVKPTIIKFGEKKDQFGPFKPLSVEAEAKLQASVNASGETFVEYVSTGLGISAEAVRGTEADVFDAPQALELGFVDEAATFEQVLAKMVDSFKAKATIITSSFRGGSAANLSKEQNMENPNPTAENNTPPPVNAAAVAADAKARVKSILTSPEASGREALAKHLAFDTDMTASAAESILKASPKATATVEATKPEGKSEFVKAMESVGNPGINAAGDTEADPETKRLAEAVSLYRQSKGLKPASAA
jgi:capsid assembly protease